MNVEQIVKAALQPLGLPVWPDKIDQTAVNFVPGSDYIVWNYVDERPVVNADDTDIYDATTIRINYFTKGKPVENKKAIRRLMRAAGFSIGSTQQFYESDTNYTHVIIECSIGGVVDD